MRTMEGASTESIIQGHSRYAVRVHYHYGFGKKFLDYSVIVDRTIDEEIGYAIGMFGISEAVYVAAEDEAWEVAAT